MEWMAAYDCLPGYSGAILSAKIVASLALTGAVDFDGANFFGREALKLSGASLGFLGVNALLSLPIAAATGWIVALYAYLGLPVLTKTAWAHVPV